MEPLLILKIYIIRFITSDKSMSQTTAGAILDNLQYLIMAIVYGSLRLYYLYHSVLRYCVLIHFLEHLYFDTFKMLL